MDEARAKIDLGSGTSRPPEQRLMADTLNQSVKLHVFD